MGLTLRLAFGRPLLPLVWQGLKRAGFILIPDLQAEGFAHSIGILDQSFFPSLSRSLTVTCPALRLRIALPVGHQLRVFCQL